MGTEATTPRFTDTRRRRAVRGRSRAAAVLATLLATGVGVGVGAPGAASERDAAVLVQAAAADAPLEVDVVLGDPSFAHAALPSGWPDAPALTAPRYLLADLDTGQVLAQRDADADVPVASTIKILTALTVLAHADVADVVTIPPEAVGIEGASSGLRAGQRLTVEELLALVLGRSANDAAVALAIHAGGDVTTFTRRMEERARLLGVEVSIADPSGLSPRTAASARDLAVLARAHLQVPALARLAVQRTIARPDGRRAVNRNLLLGAYAGATGLKTGWIQAAGGTLVATAERDGRRLVAVVLGAAGTDARFSDARALLDHGFDRFTPTTAEAAVILHDGVGAGRAVRVRATSLVPVGSSSSLRFDVPAELDGSLGVAAVVTGGDRIGPAAVRHATTLVDLPAIATPRTSLEWVSHRLQAALRAGLASAPEVHEPAR